MTLSCTIKKSNCRSRARRLDYIPFLIAPLPRSGFLFCIAVATLLLASTQRAAAQWELLQEFHATMFTLAPGVACNDIRMVGVHRNKEVYESRKDSIYWRLVSVLPQEVAGSSIVSIHLSKTNEIYVLTSKDLYRYDESSGVWARLTRTLQTSPLEKLVAVATQPGGILVVASATRLYRSLDDGLQWELRPRDINSLDIDYGNQLQYSPEGTLYINAGYFGLYKSYDHGATLEHVVPDDPLRVFTAWSTDTPFMVINDTTIWGIIDDNDLYTFDHRVPEWRLVRKYTDSTRTPRFHYGANGVLYYLQSNSRGYKSVEWSTDNGATWNGVTVDNYFDLGSDPSYYIDILYADSNRVVTYESMWLGGEVLELNLSNGKSTHRAAPIARSHALQLIRSSRYLVAFGQYFRYFYNKQGGYVRPTFESVRKHYQLTDSNLFYFQEIHTDESNPLPVVLREHPYLSGNWILRCGGCNFIVTHRGDVLTVGSGISRYDSLCTSWTFVSSFQGCHIAINRHDQFINSNKVGEFEYYDGNDILLSKGRLEPYMDSVRSIQNDTRGNLVFLGMEAAYYSGDYGLTWAQSLLPNSGSAMLKVIVDHRDHFYALDADDGIYWSGDAGASFVKLPIDFDSLYCGVTDILVDEEYLYCSTSGCGVFRCALPSLNSADFPHAAVQSGESMNLYVGQERHARITVPFALHDSPHFRLTDISGRILHAVQYTVDRRTSTLHIDTQSLSNGVYTFMIWSGASSRSGKLILRR
jgi:hypothetical protein